MKINQFLFWISIYIRNNLCFCVDAYLNKINLRFILFRASNDKSIFPINKLKSSILPNQNHLVSHHSHKNNQSIF